jgi:uncharacterized protein (UPF0332 family)
MKPESAGFLRKAREFLLKAKDALEHWPDEAGRAAYLAAFHAAQALIFENTGNVAKTHSGVRGQFGRLTQNDPRCDADLRSFLGRAYNLKAIADYETGPGSEITAERAVWAIRIAQRFVDFVAGLLVPDDGAAA